MVDRRLPALMTGENFCKSIPNGLKRVKSTIPTMPNFFQSPVPAAGDQPILPLENINTSYQISFDSDN